MFGRMLMGLRRIRVESKNVEMSTMSEDKSDRGGAVLTKSEDAADRGAIKRAVEILALSQQNPGRGFRKSIGDAIAVVEAEWKAQRERELAERHRLEKARQKAMMVREIMILPLLNDLCEDFAADEGKLLPEWQVQSGGDIDTVYGIAVTPNLNDGGPSSFTIKAEASVAEQGATLNLTVGCSCVDAQNISTGKVRQIYEKTKAATMLRFDDLGGEMWFHKQLEECARMCVLTRMRHTPRCDADSVLQAAVSV